MRAIWHTETAPRGINHDQRRLLWRQACEFSALARPKHCQGALTHTALAVLHALLWEFSEAMHPSYETLAELAGVSRASVGRAIGALRRAGFLTWVHRLKREGRRVLRSSNGYTLHLAPQSKAQSETGPQNPSKKEEAGLRKLIAGWSAADFTASASLRAALKGA